MQQIAGPTSPASHVPIRQRLSFVMVYDALRVKFGSSSGSVELSIRQRLSLEMVYASTFRLCTRSVFDWARTVVLTFRVDQ